ncbi:hypothetical protein ACHAXA_001774 [Cyclostephanos tholiformis]|uniref:L-aspartate oxidase n=1 Tax=Cyclostephanos tholiformis TaxID=382380 RepID=A0ABD3RXJ2_9STRA
MNGLPFSFRGGRVVHRICRRVTFTAGVRWSSYVGDVRRVDNLSKSYHHHHHQYRRYHHHHSRHRSCSHSHTLPPLPSSASRPTVRPPSRRAYASSSSSSSSYSSHSYHDRHDEHERLLVIGSGIAGCSAALNAARCGVRVTMLHAGEVMTDCNSYWAQGGIIYRNYDLLRGDDDDGGGGIDDDDDVDVVDDVDEMDTRSCDGGGGDGGRGGGMLIDSPRSLVEDIRVASGYRPDLTVRPGAMMEEVGRYSRDLRSNDDDNHRRRRDDEGIDDRGNDVDTTTSTRSTSSNDVDVTSVILGRKCPDSGVTWNEDAAWKLSLEGPRRVRQLLLGTIDGGRNNDDNIDDYDHDDDAVVVDVANHSDRDRDDAVGCVVPFDRVSTTAPTRNGRDGGGRDDASSSSTSTSVLSLCLEASHSAPRIIHVADRTGMAITDGITSAVMRHPLIDVVSDAIVVDLIHDEYLGDCDYDHDDYDDRYAAATTVIGARVLDGRTNVISNLYASRGVVLASGGLCGIYEQTTNPGGHNALGSSAALALRLEDRISPLPSWSSSSSSSSSRSAGGGGMGIVSDLEYVQFHPTALCVPNERRFLLTEALRGEGAILRDANGRAFAGDYHPNAELAPRDVVARAVYEECRKKSRVGDHMRHNAYLDITHRDPSWLVGRFPGVHSHLMSRSSSLDFTRDMIPVTPAAHYACGGVTTDLDGRVVSVDRRGGGIARRYRNLYAAGEAARTGLHGGNRLASTSLLEGLVFGSSVGEFVAGLRHDDRDREASMIATDGARRAIERRLATAIPIDPSASSHSVVDDASIALEATAIMSRLRSVMWDDVGVARTSRGLERAVSELSAMRDEADRLWDMAGGRGGREVVALRDAAWAGLAVAHAAMSNRVSGGSHYLVASGDEKEEGGRRDGGGAKEQDGDDDDDIGLVVARA